MLKSRTARWSTLTALLCLAVLVATWFLLIQPRRAQAAQVRAEDVAAQQENSLLRAKLDQLRQEYATLAESRAELAKIRQQLPATADLPALVRSLDQVAAATGVTLSSIVPGTALILPADGATGAGAAPTAPATATTADTVVAVPVTVSLTGDYFQVVAFLRKLQTGLPRAFLVTGIEIAKDETSQGSDVTVALSGRVFAMPGATTATGNGAAAASPGSGGTTASPGTASGVTTAPGAVPGANPTTSPAVGAASPGNALAAGRPEGRTSAGAPW